VSRKRFLLHQNDAAPYGSGSAALKKTIMDMPSTVAVASWQISSLIPVRLEPELTKNFSKTTIL
jgi:hypothetical protein